jgi:hypothetical protein
MVKMSPEELKLRRAQAYRDNHDKRVSKWDALTEEEKALIKEKTRIKNKSRNTNAIKLKKIATWDASNEEERAHIKEKRRIAVKRCYDNMSPDKKARSINRINRFSKTDEGKAKRAAQRATWTDERDKASKERIAIRYRERYKNEPIFALQKKIRTRMRRCFKTKGFKKTAHTLELLGCTWEEAVAKLEDNPRGLKLTDKGIHVDHVRPLASFKDLSSAWEQKTANHYLNLQLLPAKENLMKQASFDYDTWAISESGKALLALNREWRMETFFS